MSVIAAIAATRLEFLKALKKNEGDINLGIFEDFYPDEAHFIYELLQNAEDAEATEVSFQLHSDRCVVEHNGKRQFDERDIRAITGIFNSTKKDDPDKIGKFGVGFKSVFVYTDSPVVYSGCHSFRIVELVLPQEVPAVAGLGGKTRFELPFNSTKKDPTTAFTEVKRGLEQLSERTLLYLNNLGRIRWCIGKQEGEILREEHTDTHLEVLKQIDGKDVVSSHWLRFSRSIEDLSQFRSAVSGAERQKIAIAFELVPLGDTKEFNARLPLAKQMKIAPSVHGTVSVFFPAEKESSGLRFHLHAPFVPELSRASIKNTPDNTLLVRQLARLVAESLEAIRAADLLTGEFLAVLPNKDDSLPDRYAVIREAILDAMQSRPLVPVQGGGHAPAARLLQAKAPLKSLLEPADLELLTKRTDRPLWAIGATQRNSDQDRFLASLNIPTWDVSEFIDVLEENLRDAGASWERCTLEKGHLNWLSEKPFEWLQELYATLFRYCSEEENFSNLSDVYFVKLTSGEIGTGGIAYFQTGPVNVADPLKRVDPRALTVGSKKSQQEAARQFLEEIGVREPNEEDELRQLLNLRYGPEGDAPADKIYVTDLRRMIQFAEQNPHRAEVFKGSFVFKVDSPKFEWATSASVYIDEPFTKTTLKVLYDLVPEEESDHWMLSRWYLKCGISLEKILHFARYAGCKADFTEICRPVSCHENPQRKYLYAAPGYSSVYKVNQDYVLTREAKLLLHAQQIPTARLLWRALCKTEKDQTSPLKARFRWNQSGGFHFADSQLVHVLRSTPWVPQFDGKFVTPAQASDKRLPQGFPIDSGYRWLEALGFGADEKKRAGESAALAAKRTELGFRSEDELERARKFARLPEEDQRRILDAAEAQPEPVELPERPVRNSSLRAGRVKTAAQNTPKKDSELRQRSVQLGAEEAKAVAKVYLVDQYTNQHGQMICQACKGELPFKVQDGSYYFEAVEVQTDSIKRYRETYLALCPNHAAAYKYANAQRNDMRNQVLEAVGCDIQLSLGGKVTAVYFTETHLADVKACFTAETLEE